MMETFADVVKNKAIIGRVWVGRNAEGRKGYTWRSGFAGFLWKEPNGVEVYSLKALDLPEGAKLVRH